MLVATVGSPAGEDENTLIRWVVRSSRARTCRLVPIETPQRATSGLMEITSSDITQSGAETRVIPVVGFGYLYTTRR